jgi:hypothetical protein
MLALLTVALFAQTSISIGIGNKTNPKDSAKVVERERVRDSIRMRRERWVDSVFAARGERDSTDRVRRRAKQIALTPALLKSAFRNHGAEELLEAARHARLVQDSSITAYDATATERMSVGLGFKRIGRDRLLLRHERASRIVWSRNSPALIQVLGRRTASPIIDEMGDAEIDSDDGIPLPYVPGQENLWVGSGLAKADISESDFIHPLARGSEAYYTYAIGDSVSFRLPGGNTIHLRELLVRPRAPRWNVALGSLWFDTKDAHLVRAVYRLAEPLDIWAEAEADAKEEHDDDPPPKWVKGLMNPLKAQVTAVTVEYGLHEGRFWMPRVQSLEGSAQAGFIRAPFKIEQSFKYASVNGPVPKDIPQIAVQDTARDSVSRAARYARYRNECKEGTESRQRTRRRWTDGQAMIIQVPCDTASLAKSPELPKSIYDAGEEIFGSAERDALISEALSLGAQPGWLPQKPSYSYGLSMTRFNKIEGLSTGLGVSKVLGNGYTVHALGRIGVADWQPNGEIGGYRTNGRRSVGINAYRRLSAANDWSDPFAFGASLSAVLFGRDEGFYYRTAGVEIIGTPDDSATTTWRLFAENHHDAEKKTNFSVAHALGRDGFSDNIEAEYGNIAGLQVERHGSYGIDPHGFRLFGSARGEAAFGSFDYGRAMFDATVSHGLTKRFDGALTLGAGSSAGHLPIQRLWYLGGSQSVRGQEAGAQTGNSFWMARGELGSGNVGFRPTVFYDIGWAGDRRDFTDKGNRPMSGAGVGLSFLDGLVRFDVARGIYPEKKFRANLYVEARF